MALNFLSEHIFEDLISTCGMDLEPVAFDFWPTVAVQAFLL